MQLIRADTNSEIDKEHARKVISNVTCRQSRHPDTFNGKCASIFALPSHNLEVLYKCICSNNNNKKHLKNVGPIRH